MIRLNLALQGGGAHGAFTWGVLDYLLEQPNLQIEGISGTSAGAMNATVLAFGYEVGGAPEAKAALERFWRAVSDAALASPIQRDLWSRLTGSWSLESSPGYILFDQLTRFFSPYELNPLDINPLRDLVARMVDFDKVNQCSKIRLFVTATNVRTGRPKIFRASDMSVDAVMASAALPFVFQAVEIDSEAYWDGGYVGNPALFPLVDECEARDLVIVQINPVERKDLPVSARDIINRVNEITFNASLIKELRSVLLLKQMIESENLERESYRDMRLHRIHANEAIQQLQASSKLNAEWRYLTHLRDLGREHAEQWLRENGSKLGKESSFEVDWLMENSLRAPENCEQ